jgi:hypothetical protein
VPVVTLDVWRTGAPLPKILARMAADPRRLRRLSGVRFAKLLGTGRGSHFGPGRGDPTRWAALVVWDDAAAAAAFPATRPALDWQRLSTSHCRLALRPLASRGRWAGREPFGPASTDRASAGPASTDRASAGPASTDRAGAGPVLALTRARLRPTRALRFWSAIGPVGSALPGTEGLLTAFGIGEAPLGWQGTVSLWRGHADLVRFAYRRPEHRQVVERTPGERWYAEELFARFAVEDVSGAPEVIGWRTRP